MFHGSMVGSCREIPDWGIRFFKVRFWFKFSSTFQELKFSFFNLHNPKRFSLPADDWRQQYLFLNAVISNQNDEISAFSITTKALKGFSFYYFHHQHKRRLLCFFSHQKPLNQSENLSVKIKMKIICHIVRKNTKGDSVGL